VHGRVGGSYRDGDLLLALGRDDLRLDVTGADRERVFIVDPRAAYAEHQQEKQGQGRESAHDRSSLAESSKKRKSARGKKLPSRSSYSAIRYAATARGRGVAAALQRFQTTTLSAPELCSVSATGRRAPSG